MKSLLFESDAQRFMRSYEHAQGYHFRARCLAEQGRSASLIFNVAAVAVECYLIALCGLHGILPFNHNYRSLVMSAEEKVVLGEELKRRILALDDLFGLCSIDDYYHGVPGDDDARRIVAVCAALDGLILEEQRRLVNPPGGQHV
ncbi:hypothetical protein [Mangrovibacter yixingensis]|uniref:hypothetical protein n=1 Tax=Mangrovibacter yixingensis TaxID=1529639 RepID=UPI001CFB5C25|nr:hypothetical protein [Mangrovibacter yixingensis]